MLVPVWIKVKSELQVVAVIKHVMDCRHPVLLVMEAALDSKRAIKLQMQQSETAVVREIQLRVKLVTDTHAHILKASSETTAASNTQHATS
jgi:hypothetical protein